MLRDASHRQVIQKFSFIESLSLSRQKQRHPQSDVGKLNRPQEFSFQQPKAANQREGLAPRTQKPSQPQPQSQRSAIVPTAHQTATIDTNWYQPTSDYSLSLAEIINATSDNYVIPKSSLTTSGNHLGKILFALACSYGLFVMWWLFGHQGNNLITTLTGGKNITLSQSDVQFIDYMERSLEQIDREVAAQKQDSDNVVYVPVYSPTPATSSLPSRQIPLSSFPSNNIPPAISPSPPAPPQPLAIPSPPPLPSPTPITSSQAPAPAIASKPQISHTLIGVLELEGDRSAALVKVQGKTRRVWIGEEIHTDGSILESIGNQRATINHQGQVRSISVGETF